MEEKYMNKLNIIDLTKDQTALLLKVIEMAKKSDTKAFSIMLPNGVMIKGTV